MQVDEVLRFLGDDARGLAVPAQSGPQGGDLAGGLEVVEDRHQAVALVKEHQAVAIGRVGE